MSAGPWDEAGWGGRWKVSSKINGDLKEMGYAREDEETHLKYLGALVESSDLGCPTVVRAYTSKILIHAFFSCGPFRNPLG